MGVVPVPSSSFDGGGVAQEADQQGFYHQVLQDEYDEHGHQPVPVVLVGVAGETGQSVDGEGPAGPEEHETYCVEPVEVSVQFLVAGIYPGLVLRIFLLVIAFRHFLLGDVLQKRPFVYFVKEDVAPDEGEEGGHDCNHNGSPDHNSRPCGIGSGYDGCKEGPLNAPLDEDDAQSGQPGEELFVGELGDGVEGPAGDGVVVEFLLVVDGFGGGVGAEVDEPVEEDEEPDEPEGH